MENHTVDNEFDYVFQLSKKVLFEVRFYTLGSNKHPYFSTSADEFNQPKTDYCRCGQAQKDLCTGLARKFWEKWDKYHCKDIPDKATYDELCADIEGLKERYNFIERHGEEARYNVAFWKCKELSMQTPKKPMQTFTKNDIRAEKRTEKGQTKE